MMRETMDGTLGKKLSSSDAMAQMMEAFGDDEWDYQQNRGLKLTPEQLRLLPLVPLCWFTMMNKWTR